MRAIFLALFTFAFATVNATNYYFSAAFGDDSRSVSEAQNPSTPWKSISKLNSIFSSLSPGDAVLFNRGETFYGSISISKSREKYGFGTSTSTVPITIGAYGSGPKPVISGLQSITTWNAVGGGIYESNLNQDNLNLVTLQDVLQPIGRWPKTSAPNAGYLTLFSHSGTSSISSNAIASAPNFTGGEVVIRKFGWIIDRGTVTNQSSSTVNYNPLISAAHPATTYEPRDGFGFFFQNHINALTEAGDWMYDKSSRKIRMQFGSNSPNSYSVQAATVENLINITSSSYITIDNLLLKGANSNAINLDYSYNIQITNCDINFTGIDAIATAKLGISDNITVDHCSITNTNNNAITAYGTADWIIQNNVIKNTGIIRGMGVSGDGQYIAISSPGINSVIQNNQITNTGYNAIEFRGDNTVVKNNYIDNFCTIKSDGGGIYNSAETGSKNRKIVGNIILNGIGDMNGRSSAEANNPFAGNAHGIYLDGGASNVSVTDNTVANCSGSGMELSSSVNVNVVNNTLFNNTYSQIYYWESSGLISNLTVTDNVLFALKKNQLISLIAGSSNTTPNWGFIDNNYYCRPLSEPNNVDTAGYSKPSYDDYTDGGIIQGYNYRYYSLDKWMQFSQHDYNSKKTPVPVTDMSKVRFEYNATSSPKTISLDGAYTTAKGYNLSNSITLAPYTSVILLKTGASTILSDQTVSFNSPSNKTYGDAPFDLNATATSGLPVSFKIVSGPATLSGNTITITGAGDVVIEASQGGNASYNAAPTVVQTVKVNAIKNCKPTFLNNNTIALNPSCGKADGNISIIPTGGVPPFLYSKDGGVTYFTGSNNGSGFMSLPAGTYQLRIKDANGCESDVVTKTLASSCDQTVCTPPTFLNDATISLDASCNNNDGKISIIPTSGVAPFMYSIDGGVTYVKGLNAGDGGFMNLPAGEYRLRMKDAKGCESAIVVRKIAVVYGAPCYSNTSSSSTTETSMSVAGTTSIVSDIPSQGETVKIYPNPSKGLFKVQLLNFAKGNAEVAVIGATGIVINKVQVTVTYNNVIDFDLTKQSAGVYYIKVTSNTGTKTSKITIQR